MAVAARGLRRDTFEERRYHHRTSRQESTSIVHLKMSPFSFSTKHFSSRHRDSNKVLSPKEIAIPSPSLSKERSATREVASSDYFTGSIDSSGSTPKSQPIIEETCTDSDAKENRTTSASWPPPPSPLPETRFQPLSPNTTSTSSHTTLLRPQSPPSRPDLSTYQPIPDSHRRPQTSSAMRDLRTRLNGGLDPEEEIGVHEWENRGKAGLAVPWFRGEGTA